ncbi:prepilin-type N-terminal cleavage/methylation domain-containing protein [Variovorax paradoxus]|uniref:PulJ/GspJ family protein n=1 Tax=Variovorax paradoxus TaxID=34073 RepID=UPI0021ABCCD9|nr:prepilin-type N-terminal cleavage/methylation domain-containing protein [Variovorax paradoxus]UVH57840.1 prepilin-type N-terminal cleavage/methylation domain-containing protein [Variovorax paradoxus]
MTRPRRQAGFTLVEVMIAITIMAVLSLIAWRGLDSVSRANGALEHRTEDIARLLRALDQMDRDLALRVTTEFPLRAGDAAGPGGNGATREAGGRPVAAVAPPADLLPASLQARRQNGLPFFIEIVRTAPAAPGYWQRVQWWERGGVLYRAAGPAAAAFPLPAPDTADRTAVLNDVTAFELRAWEPGVGWRQLPAIAPARMGATGLELALAIRTSMSGEVQTFRRVFPLD